jgi:PAS domain S-box-containing protein
MAPARGAQIVVLPMPVRVPLLPGRARSEWLLMALLLTLLGAALLAWVAFDREREMAREQLRLQSLARVVRDNLERQFEAVNAALMGMQKRASLGENHVERISDPMVLELLRQSLPGVSLLAQLGADGAVRSASSTAAIGRNGVAQTRAAQRLASLAQADRSTLHLVVEHPDAFATPTISLVRLLADAQPGAPLRGMVEATLEPEHFGVLLSSVLFASDVRATLTLDDGTIFVGTPVPVLPRSRGAGPLITKHLATRQATSVQQGKALDGRERVVAFHTLNPERFALSEAVVVSLGRDPSAMLAASTAQARWAVGLFATVALGSVGGLLLTHRRRNAFQGLRNEQRHALQQSENRFRSLARMSSDWYWETDQHLRFVQVQGDAGLMMHPYLASHVGKHRWDVPALNIDEEGWQRHREELQARRPFRDFLIARSDPVRGVSWGSVSGEPFYDDAGVFQGYRGTGRDVTEVMQARDKLRQSEERLKLALRGSNDAPWDFDIVSGHFYYSDRWCELLGLDPADPRVQGPLWRELCHPDDIETVNEVLREALEGQAQAYELEARLRHQAGHYVPLMARAFITRDATGKAIRISGVSSDLREQKRAEADREALMRAHTEQRVHEFVLSAAEQARAVAEAYAQNLLKLLAERDRGILEREQSILERDNIIQERDQLLGLLAHEVRQPLNNASAALQGAMLATGDERLSRSTAAAHLERAQGVLDQVIDTVNNSLAASTLLARPEGLSLQEFEIDTLLALALADLGPAARGRVSAQRLSQARTAEINVALMRLALRNLLVNALAYSPESSSVLLTVATTEEPMGLVIEVTDQGDGISDKLRHKLFERGVRGPQSAGISGAGLGLFVVARVVALHHGQVEVRAARPRGSLFRITLPQGGVYAEAA